MEVNLKLSAVQQVRVWGCKGVGLNSLGEGVDTRGGRRRLDMEGRGGAGHEGRGSA